jgi:hypothetical protein
VLTNRPSRREFALLAAGALSGAAGCSALSSEDEPLRTSYLASLELQNTDAVERRLHVLIERDGEPVYWRTHRLGPSDGDGSHVDVDPTWDVAEGGAFLIRARVDDSPDWRTFDLTELPPVKGEEPPPCEAIVLEVREGGVGTWYNADGAETCPADG